MRFIIVSLEKRFKISEPVIKRNLISLSRYHSLKRNYYLEIYLVGDKFMEKNVLSFPTPKNFPRPDIKGKILGEIYLNPLYIKKNKESLERMLIHGVLHLLGYDHKKKKDRIKMEKKETKLIKLLYSNN
jgi:probable rRNA maturation factor